jgi:hypothetical protein
MGIAGDSGRVFKVTLPGYTGHGGLHEKIIRYCSMFAIAR